MQTTTPDVALPESVAPDAPQPLSPLAIRLSKGLANALSLGIAALPAALCWIEAKLSRRAEIFLFWGQAFSLIPGIPGVYLRRGYYRLTLAKCSSSCSIGFLSYFNSRRAEVGRRVYVGFGVSIGAVRLGDGCLIGSRASLLNGSEQHRLGPDGKLTPFDPSSARAIRVGEETWIGEAAILMADVGCRCIVAAGGVVSSPVADGCIVGGNPARFIRRNP